MWWEKFRKYLGCFSYLERNHSSAHRWETLSTTPLVSKKAGVVSAPWMAKHSLLVFQFHEIFTAIFIHSFTSFFNCFRLHTRFVLIFPALLFHKHKLRRDRDALCSRVLLQLNMVRAFNSKRNGAMRSAERFAPNKSHTRVVL